jgi:hypothetical protein
LGVAITADRAVELLHDSFAPEDLPAQTVEESYW